ncbi:MAG: transcriptional regulator [Acidocella sp. 35-58-6]|nr:MAG: transcriptional regulator [Acidocella sp. 35-58-6]
MKATKICTIGAISSAQSRAARALLGWSLDELARASEVAKRTLVSFETGSDCRSSTLQAIRTALEVAGVEFIPENGGGAGVRLRKKG